MFAEKRGREEKSTAKSDFLPAPEKRQERPWEGKARKAPVIGGTALDRA